MPDLPFPWQVDKLCFVLTYKSRFKGRDDNLIIWHNEWRKNPAETPAHKVLSPFNVPSNEQKTQIEVHKVAMEKNS